MALDHPGNAHAVERLATLIDEHVRRSAAALLALQRLEAGKLIAFEVVHAIVRAFEPADLHGALGEVEVIPSQIASLADAQPVAIDQQPDQPVTRAVPVGS